MSLEPTPPGIIRDVTGDLDDNFFGQQAVYRVSMGSFVSLSVSMHQSWVNGSPMAFNDLLCVLVLSSDRNVPLALS